ncbi:helix-turn-helix domain-containing protein [Ruania alba]|uniref:Transcriptional regulator, contains XRE-family HTH domain n=1 Tax=Ruania alba TaxID=648782 RepID=A0A1H5H7I0_9MICO|nr:helix-turn-helix transcriptional regulator [Ruania alba]SEE23952.1 Transcriptional regulator, contains XRE-family HTH domain [Ruania alba]
MIPAAAPTHVGEELRSWRAHRNLSQQELSNRSAVSTRHLSRMETGLARASAEMILRLSDQLDVPLRDRNQLLTLAGHAPRYPDRPITHPALAVVLDGLRGLVDAHLPYPALLLDDYWDIVEANTAVDQLLTGCAPELLEPPVNILRLCLHPNGLLPRIRNADQWTTHLRSQVIHRARRTQNPRHHQLADEFAEYLDGGDCSPPQTGPVLTLDLAVTGSVLRLFSTSAQITTAADATLEGLHLETFLPADEATRAHLAPALPAPDLSSEVRTR